VREVAQDAHAIHLGDYLVAEIRKSAVAGLVAAGADEVLRVVGDLHDADAEVLEHLQVAELVLDAGQVLPAERDAGLAFALGARDVGGGVHLGDEIGMLAEPVLPAHHVCHRVAEAFPDRAGAVRPGEPAAAHVLEHLAAEVGDDQAVENGEVAVQLGAFHGSNIISFTFTGESSCQTS
jgi:hypothetical protein